MIYIIPPHLTRGFLLLSLIWILGSCTTTSTNNNKTDNSVNPDIENKEVETSILRSVSGGCTIDTTLVIDWNSFRKDSSQVKTIFNDLGNIFSFSMVWNREIDTAIHAYLGVDTAINNLSLTLVNAGVDVKSNRTCIVASKLNKTKEKLPRFSAIHINRDSISFLEAEARVEAWNDSTIRNNWIKERFINYEDSASILQAFVITGENLSYGDTHDCYMGLKLDKVKNTYSADLILVNYNAAAPDSLGKNLEDLTLPIPPFKASTNLDKSLFGLINEFNLN